MIEPIILGLAWLDKWQPNIWWERGYRKLRLTLGPEPPRSNDTPPGLGNDGGTGRGCVTLAPSSTQGFPSVYDDLAAVFSEEECEVLPPHRPTDCAIEFIPGAKLPKPRMYSMTQKELTELRQYIDKNLARGFIKPSRSHMAAPVLSERRMGGCAYVLISGALTESV